MKKKTKLTSRIDDEIAYNLKVFSAVHRRQLNDVLEEAIRDFFKRNRWQMRKIKPQEDEEKE